METISSSLDRLRRLGQKWGPYLIIEILLPGGSLVALLLFLCQRRKPCANDFMSRSAVAVTRMLAGIGGGFTSLASCAIARPARSTTLRSAP
jgi:hypothetical protein